MAPSPEKSTNNVVAAEHLRGHRRAVHGGLPPTMPLAPTLERSAMHVSRLAAADAGALPKRSLGYRAVHVASLGDAVPVAAMREAMLSLWTRFMHTPTAEGASLPGVCRGG